MKDSRQPTAHPGQDALLALLRDPMTEGEDGLRLPQLMAPPPALLSPEDPRVTKLMEARAVLHFALTQLDIEDPTAPTPAWAAALADDAVRWVQRQHPFVPFDAPWRQRLATLYQSSLLAAGQALGGTDDVAMVAFRLRKVLTDQRMRLAQLLDALDRSPQVPGRGFVFREIPNAEYSAALQLRILGLNTGALMEPVLDLGCGREARLVQHLREAGLDVTGVDRAAPEGQRPDVQRGDWLETAFERERWGTIIAHQSFSTHFLHHHLRGPEGARRYAQAYMTLLGALRQGGTFAYAPGLPFIEGLLPATSYRVTRLALPETPPGMEDAPEEIREALGATRVTRL